ncbi:MAG: F420-0--gamma-glutamyl ligase [Firmicutes bacterium]|nr:F420-0--gamma-glutamyl ligase [Bacillota bacterium]
MVRTVGTTVRGIRAPLVREGDDLVNIVVDCVLRSAEAEGFTLRDRDIVGITESLVARTQGNYASIDDITADINSKFTKDKDIAVLFPILSRNRFAQILKGIANTGKKIYLLLSYPCDEVGNCLMDIDVMDEAGLNPHTDVLTETRYREIFGERVPHPFTGIDYVQMYKELGDNIEIILANDPRVALNYSKEILVANVHDRARTKRILIQAGAEKVYTLDQLLTEPRSSGGYHPEFGLLGSNSAGEDRLKLFPRDCPAVVREIQQVLKARTGKQIEVMVFGDGAFKDPRGRIWELADPVVSPGFTDGLMGTPNEIKLKYIVDTELAELSEEERIKAAKEKIRAKENNSVSQAAAMGTTPRQLTDLLGSLCDLTSGSGDKGTPIVLIQGYFDSYAAE